MENKKKPNYKLRRTIAKIILVLLIIIPIILINRVKIMHIPVYLNNMEYKSLVSAFFSSNYNNKETASIIDTLKKKKLINKIDGDIVIELNNKGYNHNTINFVLLNMSKTEIRKFLNKKYDKDFEEYLSLELFDYEKYERYVDYQADHKDLSLEDVVIRVELDLDKDPYEDTTREEDPNSLTALVNKHRYISKDYVPDDLVEMDDEYANNTFGVKEIRKETYEQFKKMVDDAKKDNITFYAESGYRDFEYQDDMYYEYVYQYGEKEANTFAAKAGYSEHQLGTTLDLANVWTIEEGDEEYKWIDKNGYKYGFIFRYKKESEDITGYEAEGWHIRYVGVEAATIIHKKNLTFDEYWVKYVYKKNKGNN